MTAAIGYPTLRLIRVCVREIFGWVIAAGTVADFSGERTRDYSLKSTGQVLHLLSGYSD